MAVPYIVGKDAKAYYNTATYTTPTWVEIVKAADISVDLSKAVAEAGSRQSEWTAAGAGQKTASVEMSYLSTPGTADTVFDALLDMYINDTPTDMAFMNEAIATSGAEGLRAYFICTAMPQEQALNEFIVHTFTFQVTLFDDSGTLRSPAWYEV